jgi:hypothetical protein
MAVVTLLAACGMEDSADPLSAVSTSNQRPNQGTNHAPVITGTPQVETRAGDLYIFQANASDPDGDALNFSATGLPDWATLDARSGKLMGVAADEDVGVTADIVISVSDGKLQSELKAFRIAIQRRPAPDTSATPAAPAVPATHTNTAPTIWGSPPGNVDATKPYTFTPSASDADSIELNFSIANLPPWAGFSTATGRISGTPSASQVSTYSNIVIAVSDGAQFATLPAFAITVTAPPNRAPTISGTPPTSAKVNAVYTFTPTAADPDGQILTYSIANKPSWATFDITTGRLSGTPAGNRVFTYPNIVITASDGELSASLPAFAITVSAATGSTPSTSAAPPASAAPSASSAPSLAPAPPPSGAATLRWSAPTENADGSALTNLAGYRIYHGTSSSFTEMIQIAGAGNTSYTFSQLAGGTHYFAVAAYNAAGMESALSSTGSKIVQ